MHGSLARALLTLGFTVFLPAILPACSWSSGSDGYFQAWLDGKQVMSYSGATLYAQKLRIHRLRQARLRG